MQKDQIRNASNGPGAFQNYGGASKTEAAVRNRKDQRLRI